MCWNVYSQNVYSQNVYSQNVYSHNVYCAKMPIPIMSTVPKCLFPKCLLLVKKNIDNEIDVILVILDFRQKPDCVCVFFIISMDKVCVQ